MGVVAYQELTYAMGQNNLSADDTQKALGRLNQRLGEARSGSKKYRDGLKDMGVSLEELDAGLLSTDEAFMQVIQSLHETSDAQLQAKLAGDIFGVNLGRKMLPIIRTGAQDVDELRKRAHELGIVMEEEAARKSEIFGDTMDDLKGALGGMNRTIGQELLAPGINIGRMFTDLVAGATKWIKENPKLLRQIIMIGGAIVGVLAVLATLGTTLILTGKIIGALGAVFNILTSKPMLIIAAIGMLWVAWDNDWGNIRTKTKAVWAVLEPIFTAMWDWLKKAWTWTIDAAGNAWDWLINTTWSEKIEDMKRWLNTAWRWVVETAGTAWEWLKGTNWSDKLETLKGWLGVAWQWIINTAGNAWDWFKGTKLYDKLIELKNLITDTKAWKWAVDVAVPAIVEGGKMVIKAVVEATGKMYDAIKKGFATGEWGDFFEIATDWWQKGVSLALGIKLAVGAGAAILKAIGGVFGNAAGTLGAGGLPLAIGALSVAIQLAEAKAKGSFASFGWNMFLAVAAGIGAGVLGGPGAGMMVFTIALNLKLGENLKETHDEMLELKPLYEKWFAEQQKSMKWYEKINPFKQPSYDDFLKEYKEGAIKTVEAWGDGVEAAESVVFKKVENMAKGIGDMLIGQSPPPKGPLKNLTIGAQAAMAGWVAGAEEGLEKGEPVLSQALVSIKKLFASVWDKVPEDVRVQVESAIDWMMGLIGQAEEALFKLDDFQSQLDELFGGGSNTGAEAEGFMARLTAGLGEKLEKLDEPINRFIDAIWGAGGKMMEFVKLISAGSWQQAFLAIVMETESFALAMELLGKVMGPVVSLFDMVLRPVIEFIIGLWNAIMRGLSSISIFGWKPFGGLANNIVDIDGGSGGRGTGGRSSSGGRQVSEITGPSRDFLGDLLAPLANFGQVVAPIHDIRDITSDIRGLLGGGFGAGELAPAGVNITFGPGSVVVQGGTDGKFDMAQLAKELSKMIFDGQRGRGGR